MKATLNDEVAYHLELSEIVPMNNFIGKPLRIEFNGRINCSSCGAITKKTFGGGFCYKCFTTAPEASECIIRPELCRGHLGEGRDAEWEDKNHNQPHVVYLAASSAIKVGVTRASQVPTRWIDQGASSAVILCETPNRYEAGVIEVAMKSMYTDKTSWQKMLKNDIDENIDLLDEKWSLEDQLPGDILEYFSEDETLWEINYPVEDYPEKVKSLSLDKTPVVEGVLQGIKGQYLIFEGGLVFNVRKHTGYYVQIS
ncbi:MAG: DUF2797 domain-containing protein [Fluviicola sp.]